ncbi:class I SAM-dependent methyltransferase [Methylobacterium haplocladii]|uniref:Methyltransferase type 11 domain-containing protein n=1 Tax=Methylobacterium haplocladii TaxID=1176176 RepID=A0A512IVY5_9HYPH|nr:class I SAM-dependent methyltransferase [Methylobacterium haplocladii]GEP01877.1 hypothetical protein MHA02_42640 [Methylobacterium haplocladii]GJD86442.1 Ubiquinone biosynthesis O-methyltransferase, mitochondrial [Methylobacterium haplocladii]GLS61169.1 hypothetical protein GCM10007887_38660 [Methylobacterium haplocladii]
MNQRLLSFIGDVPLNKLFENWVPARVEPEGHDWLDLPPADFLDWCRKFPDIGMWYIPPHEKYIGNPSFLVSQAHRVWTTTSLLNRHCDRAASLLDLGSYPFVVPVTLRDYFGFTGKITGTVIQPLNDTSYDLLSKYQIATDVLDLDPFVVDLTRQDRLPTRLQIRDNTQDAVTLFHVMEHLYHPMPTLKEAHRVLKPGGKIFITTDNAFMLNVFNSILDTTTAVFEPVEGTSAMQVHDWRGHVRFFSERDLSVMLQSAGFEIVEIGYREIYYDVLFDDHFVDPNIYIQGWRTDILRDMPSARNDIYVVAQKSA